MMDSDRELEEISANKSKGNEDTIFLIECPACHKSISNQAYSCPHCGHPMKVQEQAKPSTPQPPVVQKSGLGFWGVVLAIIVAVLILSLG